MRIILCCLLLTACGYRFEGDEWDDTVTRITVPYVSGDFEGKLTDELISQLSTSGRFDVRRQGGDLVLHVAVKESLNDRIGYQFSRDDKSGSLQKHLISTENRRIITVEVSLVNCITGETLIPPSLVSASSEYDYTDSDSKREMTFIEPDGKRTSTLKFSLGQLDSVEGAQDATLVPLYRRLAQKIVDGLISSSPWH